MLRQSLRSASTLRSAAKAHGARAMSAYSLPSLPYDLGALEPVVNTEIMTLHHGKHHATYVANLNAALEKYADAEAKKDVAAMIALQGAIKFNGGGHVNHSIFWTNLCAPKDVVTAGEASPELAKMIDAQWGSIDAFKTDFNTKTAAVQGSGWGWLGYDKAAKKLAIATCANQDVHIQPPGAMHAVAVFDQMDGVRVPGSSVDHRADPLLGIDVWEHAYYLQYKNVRPEYLKQVWQVVNWKNVAERFKAASA